ncbi:MAG: hypothetical protein Q8O92_12210 [Candidatus Latescibacter sp.]|nr:hypothetical protein [Candidatus Latescibacter sp.]
MCNLFSDSSSLYFFSALLQSNAAIISLVGIFVIFKIQSLQSKVEMIRNFLISNPNKYPHPKYVIEFDNLILEDKSKKIDNNTYIEQEHKLYFNKWVEILKKIEEIKNKIKKPTILIVSSLIAFVFCLMFASSIHKLGVVFELVILSLSTGYEIYIVVVVFRTISNLIYLKEETV